MDSRQQQIQHDAQLGNTQVGNIYYSICPDDNRYFRTIRIARNPFTGNLQTQISNITPGDPPPDMKPIPPLMRTKLMSCSNALPY